MAIFFDWKIIHLFLHQNQKKPSFLVDIMILHHYANHTYINSRLIKIVLTKNNPPKMIHFPNKQPIEIKSDKSIRMIPEYSFLHENRLHNQE